MAGVWSIGTKMILSHTQPVRFIKWVEYGEHRHNVKVGKLSLDLRLGCELLAPPAKYPYNFHCMRRVYDALAYKMNRFDLLVAEYRTFDGMCTDPVSGRRYPYTIRLITQASRYPAPDAQAVDRFEGQPLVHIIKPK